MCYGSCTNEGYMGSCSVSHIMDEIKEKTGFRPCFIGGNVTCEEEYKEYKEMLENEEIKKMKEIIYKIEKEHNENFKKILFDIEKKY